MSLLRTLLLAGSLGALAGLTLSTHAQTPTGGGPVALNSTLLRALGTTNAFSARAEVRLLDRTRNQEMLSLTMNFAQLFGRVRAEIDMARIKSREMGSNDVAALRQLGLDQIITVVRLDQRTMLYAYPTLRGYVELPLPDENPEPFYQTAAGSEEVEGRSCVKFRITSDGQSNRKDKLVALVWKARDPRHLPVKAQIYQPDAVVEMTFKDIRASRPQPGLFDPPVGYKRYDSLEALTLSRMLGTPSPLP
ncbi:MAG TPA: hypothetical protein VNO52_09270 [Methylomirabilota bacterium]|nr:hypothetical protein [Methylomirabilota bacterium]